MLITRLTTQRWLDVGTEWIEDEHRSAHSQMVYEYRVTCLAHYYGKGCENLCRPRDDSFGHYSCSPTGERVCLSGWKGDYCATRKYTLLLTFYLELEILLRSQRSKPRLPNTTAAGCKLQPTLRMETIPCAFFLHLKPNHFHTAHHTSAPSSKNSVVDYHLCNLTFQGYNSASFLISFH